MKRIFSLALALLLCVALLGACAKEETAESRGLTTAYADEELGFQLELPEKGDQVVVMKTSMGDIYIRLFPEGAP